MAASENPVSHSDNPLANLAEEEKINLLYLLGYCVMQIHRGRFEQLSTSEKSLLMYCLPNTASDRSLSDREEHVRSLANFYCNILTNGKIAEYSETLTEEDLYCSFPVEALDIIAKLANGRIAMEQVMQHPFFWTDEQKVNFICKAFEFILGEERLYKSHELINKYNMGVVPHVLPGGWTKKLKLTRTEIKRLIERGFSVRKGAIHDLIRVPSENKETLFELLRFFRNRYIHMHLDQMHMYIWGNNTTGYLKFFSSRFPRFFMHVYENMLTYIDGDGIPQVDFEKRPSAGEFMNKLKLPAEVFIEGTTIRYYPDRRLQPGANVFQAKKYGVLEQNTVIKFITNYVEKNKREVQHLMDAGSSEYVVKYYESGFCKYNHEEAMYILMEQCETKTLSDRIVKGDLSYEIRKKYVRRIAEGLQHLKNKNIVHRDLKPNNILFRDGSPVISDFGISKKLSEGKTNTVQSIPDVGTNGWRAPETSGKNGVTSHKTDIYSAGLVAHFVLTNGAHPYEDESNRLNWQTRIDDDKNGSKCNLQALYETPDGANAFDLIESMLRREPKDRPLIEAVLKHPFFLNAENRLEFLSNASAAIKEGRIPLDLDSFDGEKYGKEVKDETKNWNVPTQEDGATSHANSLAEEVVKKRRKIDDTKSPLAEKAKRSGKLLLTKEEMATIKENFEQKGESVKVDDDVMIGLTISTKGKQLYDGSVAKLLWFIRNRHTHRKEDEDKKIISMTREQFFKFFSDRFPHLFIYVYYSFEHYYFPKEGSNKDLPDDMEKYFAK